MPTRRSSKSSERLDRGIPLSFDDGLTLYRTPTSTGSGAWRATSQGTQERPKVFYVLNRYINSTNVCFAGCTFCSFAADEFKEPQRVFRMTADQVFAKAVETGTNFNQIHIVGGHDPRQLSLDYWLPLMRRFKEALAARAALALHRGRDRVYGQASPAVVSGDRHCA